MKVFEFMLSAFYALVGVCCLALAVMIVYALVVGVCRIWKERKRNARR